MFVCANLQNELNKLEEKVATFLDEFDIAI